MIRTALYCAEHHIINLVTVLCPAPRRLCTSMLVIAAFVQCMSVSFFAHATPVEAVISDDRIMMDAGFTGTEIFFVGARNDIGDIVVAIRGPQKNYIIRKKEDIAGVWINRSRMKFFNVPGYYAIATSKPLSEIEQSVLFTQLGIGQNTLLGHHSYSNNPIQIEQFSDAFLNYQYSHKLFTKGTIDLEGGERLVKARIHFPDTIPTGKYTAEIYLFSDGEIVGMQSTPLRVEKSGVDAYIHRSAHEFPITYGLASVLLALSIGWLGNRLLEKI